MSGVRGEVFASIPCRWCGGEEETVVWVDHGRASWTCQECGEQVDDEGHEDLLTDEPG